MGRAPVRVIAFRVDVPPIVANTPLAAWWTNDAAYDDGFPGAAVPPGPRIPCGGIDTWRVEDDKIAAYRVSWDGPHLMAVLEIGQECNE